MLSTGSTIVVTLVSYASRFPQIVTTFLHRGVRFYAARNSLALDDKVCPSVLLIYSTIFHTFISILFVLVFF